MTTVGSGAPVYGLIAVREAPAGADPSSMLPQKRHLTAASWIDSAQKGQGFTAWYSTLPVGGRGEPSLARQLLRHLLAELRRSGGGRLHRVDQGAAEAARLQRVQPGDGGAAGARHHVLEAPRVLPGLELELGGAVHRLRRE